MDLFDRVSRFANQFTDLLGELADDVRAHVELGAALLERGDYDAAIAELGLAILKRRDHARARYLLGLCYLRRGQPGDNAEAKREFALALAAREGYAEAQIAFGDALRQGGELEQAAESYRLALPLIADGSERTEVERSLGTLYLELGQIDKAVRELRKAASAIPDDAAVQGLLGQALLQSAQRKGEPPGGPTYDAARQCLGRAAKSEHPDPQVLAALGALLLAAGQVPDAEKALLRALKEEPELVAALLTLGKLRLVQGDSASAYEQALRAYASATRPTRKVRSIVEAIEETAAPPATAAPAASAPPAAAADSPPTSPAAAVASRSVPPDAAATSPDGAAAAPEPALLAEIHTLLARCHSRSGAPERALFSYDEALRSLPGDAHRQDERRALLSEALHLALVHELWPQAAELGARPLLTETADGLAAQVHAPALPLAEAEALLQRAQATGDSVEVRLAAATVELRRGANPAAAAQLRRAAALAPNDQRPRRALQALYQKERAALPRELYGLLQRALELCASTPELTLWLAEAGRLVEALDRPLLITVMGEFNSGKSTFVNALLGEEVAPMGITPTTATINLLKYGRELGGRVVYRDGQSRAVPWAKVPALLRGLDAAEAQRIKVVEVLYPLDVLQRVNVVDTPGLNSILPEHEATAREFIAQADAVIWLFTVDQAGKASEREALQSIRAAGKKILGVLNKIDRIDAMAQWAEKLAPAVPTAASEPSPAAPPPASVATEPPAEPVAAKVPLAATVPPAASAEDLSLQSPSAALPATASAEPPAARAANGEPPAPRTAPEPLAAILAHLNDPTTGLVELLEVIVPFSGREALLGRRQGDGERLQRANLPALEQALEERFFARAQAIKNASAQARLAALLDKAREQVSGLWQASARDELDQELRLCQADSLLFLRDFIPAERRRLIADADSSHKLAAREILDFVRPRRWPFGEHQAAPADRDFLLVLLDDKLAALTAASRARVVAALAIAQGDRDPHGDSDNDLLRLLDEQVYGRYRAFSRGYLRGGKVDDFFVRILPRLELTEAAIGRALERDAPTAVDILEAELLTPLRSFGEVRFKLRAAVLQKQLEQEELRRLDLDERVLYPLEALRDALSALTEAP